MAGARERLEGVKARREVGHASTSRFDCFGLKTGELVTSCGGVREGLTGLASKPGETGLTGLGLKTGGVDLARSRSGRRARGAIAKLASRRSEVVKATCPSVAPTKSWMILRLRGHVL